jgi:maltooligosyltrehalose trehalohydrolase
LFIFWDSYDCELIPYPNAATTFEASRLNWNEVAETRHRQWLNIYQQLLQLRHQYIIPRLSAACNATADYEILEDRGLQVCWKFPDSTALILVANLGIESLSIPEVPDAPIIYASGEVDIDSLQNNGTLPNWSVVWFLKS